jgi:4-amino-4-deoxy-L-arabinose transferase-like glycosyltransferase
VAAAARPASVDWAALGRRSGDVSSPLRRGRRYDRGVPVARLALAIVALFFIGWRFAAPGFNSHPHGDVHLDAITLDSMLKGEGLTTPLERSLEYYPREMGKGYPLDQHPPLSLWIAAAFSLLGGDAYFALTRVSLFASLLTIVVALLLGRRYAGPQGGLVAATVCATSFALADFAGNGAIYTLHGLFALVAALLLARGGGGASVLAGAALGAAWLANYQALVLLPAAAVALCWREGGMRIVVRDMALLALGFALAAGPWWIRNHEVFGDPLFSVNPYYLKWKLGGALAVDASSGLPILTVETPPSGTALRHLLDHLRVNARFVFSQAAVWISGVLPLAAVGIAVIRRSRRGAEEARATSRCGIVVVPLFALAHLAVMLLWPSCKFRYFVPLLPLLAVLAAIGAAVLDASPPPPRAFRRFLVLALLPSALIGLEMTVRGRAAEGAIVLVAIVLAGAPLFTRLAARIDPAAPSTSALLAFALLQLGLLAASPTRTSYYDAILVGDAFGRRGAEAADHARQEALGAAASQLAARGVTAIVADVELKHHAIRAGSDLRVIQPPATGDEAADLEWIRAALARHGARHVLAEEEAVRAVLARSPAYRSSLPLAGAASGFSLVEFAP